MVDNQGWINYEKIKSHLRTLSILDATKSRYWEEESSSIEYLLEATPAIIARLRDHTHWLTSIRSYDYKSHHQHKSNAFLPKYFALRQLDPNLPFHGELGILGDFGFNLEDNIVNLDTLKFFESIMALNLSGNLLRLKNMRRPIIVEIGAGWGGFLAMLKQYVPDSQLIIVDLPLTLIFSATYLPTAFPDSTVGFFGSPEFSGKEDFIFITSEQFQQWDPEKIDLAINMVSFQEMTSTQVVRYGQGLLDKNCSVLYSHNQKRSSYNHELVSVDMSLSDWPHPNIVELLDVDYTTLSNPRVSKNLVLNSVKISYRIKILGLVGKVSAKLPITLCKKINFYISEIFSEKVKSYLLEPEVGMKFSTIPNKRYDHKIYYSDKDLEHLRNRL